MTNKEGNDMTKKEVLSQAQVHLMRAQVARKTGNQGLYVRQVQYAKACIARVNTRLYIERLSRMVNAFPKSIVFH